MQRVNMLLWLPKAPWSYTIPLQDAERDDLPDVETFSAFGFFRNEGNLKNSPILLVADFFYKKNKFQYTL